MNQIASGERTENDKPVSSDIQATAERVASFFTAVKQLFGPGEAERAANDWLQELQAMNDFCATTPNWRQLTINAVKRLALRVNH